MGDGERAPENCKIDLLLSLYSYFNINMAQPYPHISHKFPTGATPLIKRAVQDSLSRENLIQKASQK